MWSGNGPGLAGQTKRSSSAILLLSLLSLRLVAFPAPGKYLRTADVNVAALIPPAPADNSLTTVADITTLLEMQKRRTPKAVALAAYFADHDTAFLFGAVLGPWFTPSLAGQAEGGRRPFFSTAIISSMASAE